MAVRLRRWALLLALCLLIPTLPRARAEAEREWTILAYMCGSDLETTDGEASYDIREMLASRAGASERAEVLLATGGTKKWFNYGISSEQVQYYRLGSDAPELLQEVGDVSMGRADTLSGFLRWGMAQAPARRYALILWDHGGGPVYGACYDERHNDDALTLNELRQALAAGLGGRKLDILAFDACLMNSIDAFAVAADFASYAVASQEFVTGYGLDYDSWMPACAQDPAPSALDVARRMAETYVSDSASKRWRESATMAVVDCAAMPAVVEAANRFSRALTPLLTENRTAVVRLRSRLTSFGEFIGSDASDLVDVAAMCDAYAALLPVESALLKQAAAAAVVCNETTSDFSGKASGLSFFLPYSTARSDKSEILSCYQTQSGEYAELVTAMTTAIADGGDYSMATASQAPSSFYTTNGSGSASGSLFSIWSGLFGDAEAPAQSASGSIWAGLGAQAAASPTPAPIWAGLSDATHVPSPVWSGLATEAPTASPAPQTASAMGSIWEGLLNAGYEYYQPGEDNANLQPGVSEALAPETLAAAADSYFSASALTAQSVYTLQLTKGDLDHLTDASGVLFKRDGSARIRLGDIGQTQIDWSTGLIFSMFDGSWPMLQGRMVRAERVDSSEDGSLRFVIPARVNGARMYILASRDMNGATEVLGATQGYAEGGFAIRGSIPLLPGMTVTPLYTTVAANGSETETEGEAIRVPEGGLTLSWDKLPAGEYEYCFRLTDLSGGAQYTESVQVTF